VAGICSAGPGAGYVFSGDGQLWFTGDGGANWEKRARVFDPGTQGFVADYARFRQIVSCASGVNGAYLPASARLRKVPSLPCTAARMPDGTGFPPDSSVPARPSLPST